jgi:hypothetical protein
MAVESTNESHMPVNVAMRHLTCILLLLTELGNAVCPTTGTGR